MCILVRGKRKAWNGGDFLTLEALGWLTLLLDTHGGCQLVCLLDSWLPSILGSPSAFQLIPFGLGQPVSFREPAL